MKIGVLWRKCRNVEFQKKIAPEAVVDDSYEEACQHAKGLEDAGYDVAVIEWTSEPMLTYERMKKEKVDLVFNVSSDEEICFLEAFHIPYTGSRIQTVVTDKAVRKIIASYYGVTTPAFAIARSVEELPEIRMDYPLFVKPLSGRGSAGIDDTNIIASYEALPPVVEKITAGIGQPALIESFIEGRELTVGIIGYKDPEVLPLLEIGYAFGRTNTFEHKMFDKELISCPMEIPKEVEERIIKMALRIYDVLDVADFGRIDMILSKDNIPYFLEVNTFAGLNMPDETSVKTAHYGYMGYMAKAKGYTRAQFMDRIVKSTIERYNLV